MTSKFVDIEMQALSLSPEEKEMLAGRLLTSVQTESFNEIDQAWIAEAEKRYDRYKQGLQHGIPGEQFFQEIRRELGW